MAGTRRRGRWSVVIFLLLMSTNISAFTAKPDSAGRKCPPGDYENEAGICCNKCHAGFKLKAECRGEGQRSLCEPCPNGQFLEQINYSATCFRCRTCRESRNEFQVSSCKTTQNTICRCKDGYYKDNIDTETYECLRCSKCGQDEMETKPCTHEKNTVCECKENYHRVNGKCEPCRDCNPDCTHHCVSLKNEKGPDTDNLLLTNVISGSAVVVFVLLLIGVLITFMATKQFTKRKLLSQASQPSDDSIESGKHLLISVTEPSENNDLTAVVQTPVAERELLKLPDCVPLEIRIPDLIYTVLDLVPVLQVKQLVRSLGVTDTEIEQAELDHRSCREAHYQMLRVWTERGSRAVGGGRGEMLHQPLLEELLDKLRQMHLGRAAEELETKYPIQ